MKKVSIENLVTSAEATDLFNEEWKNSCIIGLAEFLEKSTYRNVFKYRALIGFRNVLIHQDVNMFSEKELEKMYNQSNNYKSLKMLEIIKIFLFSKDMIRFDKPLFLWATTHLENSYYYQSTILDYYFDNNKCSDCGTPLNRKSHHFCDKCLSRHSVVNFCVKVEQDETFKNESVRIFFKSFLNFLFDSRLAYSYIDLIVDIGLLVFQQLDQVIGHERNILSFSKNEIQEVITPQWIAETFETIPVSSFSKKKRKLIKTVLGHFVGYLEKENLIPKESFIPEIIVTDENITIIIGEKSDYQKIKEKIENVPEGFQALLFYRLELDKKKNEVLEKKNARKSLRWKSIEKMFRSYFRLINYLESIESVDNWTLVNQEIINRYFLIYEKQQYRDIERRSLYNFFEFGRKNRFLLQNPIQQFKAKDYSFTERALTRKDQKELVMSINLAAKENPTDSLVTSLCYFHAFTSQQIRELKISQIYAERKCIILEGRAPAYLDEREMRCLTNHLKMTEYDREHYNTPYLFFSILMGKASQINNKWVNKHVKNVYEANPSTIRRAGLQFCAEKFGPQYLHDCFGLSLSHMSRFGDTEEYLIEELIEDELKYSGIEF